jgi:hypothetical protein
MFAMSGKHLFTAHLSAQSGRLITCLIFLLLTVPLIEQAHQDRCEHAVCATCTLPLGSLVAALEHFTVTSQKPAGIVRNETTISARQAFSRPYDGRGPPQIS